MVTRQHSIYSNLKMARSMLLLYMLRRQLMDSETSTDEASTDEYTSGEELSDQETSEKILTDQGTSGKVLIDQGISSKEATDQGTSEKELTEQTTSEDVNSRETLHIEQEAIIIKKEACGENKCRVCLEEGFIPVYGEDTGNISEVLMILCGIEVRQDDPFPKFICESCNTLLEAAILLRKTAQESDRKLKHPVEDMLVAGDDMANYDDNDKSSDYELCKETNLTNIEEQFLQTEFELVNQSYNTLEQPCNDRKQSQDTLEQPYNVKKHTLNIDEQPNIKLKKYYCMKCEISFNTFEDYTDHKSSQEHKNKRVISIQKQSNNSPSHSEMDLTVHSEDYMCDLCGKKCTFQSDLVSHRKIHFLNVSSDND